MKYSEMKKIQSRADFISFLRSLRLSGKHKNLGK